MYGVYMPTQQEYLNLFSNYAQQDPSIKEAKHLVDLGCGSGILSIVAKERGGFSGKYTLMDFSETALECAKMNLELYGVFETSYKLQNVDVVDLWFPVSGTLDNVFRHK